MNKELLNEAVEPDNYISQLKKHLQEVKDWAKKQSGKPGDNYIRIVSSSAPDSALLRAKYLPVSFYISALESEIEELEIKFNNL